MLLPGITQAVLCDTVRDEAFLLSWTYLSVIRGVGGEELIWDPSISL